MDQRDFVLGHRTECSLLELQYLRHASREPAYSPALQDLVLNTLLTAKNNVEAKLKQYLAESAGRTPEEAQPRISFNPRSPQIGGPQGFLLEE